MIEQSRWSSEFVVGPRVAFTDYPLMLLGKCIPAHTSSLDIFLRKFTKAAQHFAIPVDLQDLQLHLFGLPMSQKSQNTGR